MLSTRRTSETRSPSSSSKPSSEAHHGPLAILPRAASRCITGGRSSLCSTACGEGEIAQLRTSDVLMVDGVMVMRVRKDAETGRRTKTMYSRRIIPVHPELQRMGFLAFVDEQRRGEHAELFPGSAPNANGQWGDNFSDWFTRLVASHRLTGQRLGLHSFRHNFEDALRAAGLKGSDIDRALAGRARQGGNDSGDTYGSGYPATQLADALALVTYPGLDLSHLHVAQLPGTAASN